jgi:hypothetical protein
LAVFLREVLLVGAAGGCGDRSRTESSERTGSITHAPNTHDARGSAAEAECDTVTDHEQRFDISASDMRRRRESVDTMSRMVNRMTDERRFEELLSEFTRVGVDLNSFPAGIGVHRDDALRILRSLPDGAGPAAFLSRVRQEQHSTARSGDGDAFSAAGD